MPDSDSNDITRSHVQLAHGNVIGHYRIIERIGAGGMGEVYLAEDTKLHRKVALKFLPLHLCQDPECRARFTRETEAAAQLDHPSIVAVHEVGEYQGRPFFSMQHVEGQSLKEVIAGKMMPLDRIVEIGIQVCDGLQAAHEKGIIHRDIKPSNILIDSHGRARIVDFGLASVMGLDHLTKTGSTLGTIGYMSPEQVRGETVDHRTDLFSFGVVLYEMITGHAPFKTDSEAATLHAITDTKPELLARYRREVPTELQTVIDKALDKNVATRYQHADEIAANLKRLSSAAMAQHVPRRSLWNRYVVTSAIVLLLAVVGYFGVTKFLTKGRQKIESTRKMLAVLPFENLSPDPDQEYFSDGLTEELTSNLSRIQSLCVISRRSAMTFKGSNKTVPEIAQVLGVRYIVEGSVRKAGKELRIAAQLIDASDDVHLWAKTYTGTLDDVFNMQDSVTHAIIDGISVRLTPDETRRISKRSIDNPLAYQYYLRGKDIFDKGTENDLRQCIQYLQQGAEIVGDNALILSGLAWTYWGMVNSGFAQEDYISKGEEYAQRALELDPELAEIHALLGSINNTFFGNQVKAVEHYKRALAIDPNNTAALGGLSIVYCMYVGNVPAAAPLEERLLIVSPLDSLQALTWQGGRQFWTGDFCPAIEPWRQAVGGGSKGPSSYFFYCLALAYCDSTGEALSVIEDCSKRNPTSSISGLMQVMKFALQNDKENALSALTPDVRRTCRRDAGWSYHLGAVLARARAKEEAYDWLVNAADRGFINYPFWQKDPFLDSIRGDERFEKLMERVRYEWEHFEV